MMSPYPPISLRYLRSLTDDTGILQHGVFAIPNRQLGYTTDDNSRALIVAVRGYEHTQSPEILELIRIYLSFLHYAHTPEHRFSNIMTFQRMFLDSDGTEDCFGRCLWGCGVAASADIPVCMGAVAKKIFDSSMPWVGDLVSPRARAYSMVGMCEYVAVHKEAVDVSDKIHALADSLEALFREYSSNDWVWFEPYMTYGNAILPVCMLLAGSVTGKKRYTDIGRRTIDFLAKTTIVDDRLEIIGNNGWYMRGGNRPWYDQQSIDAGYSAYAFTVAYSLLGDKRYLDHAFTCYDWFFGNNRSEMSVYDPQSGGCRDGINPTGVNENQGAEACFSFLLAQLALHNYIEQRDQSPEIEHGAESVVGP